LRIISKGRGPGEKESFLKVFHTDLDLEGGRHTLRTKAIRTAGVLDFYRLEIGKSDANTLVESRGGDREQLWSRKVKVEGGGVWEFKGGILKSVGV